MAESEKIDEFDLLLQEFIENELKDVEDNDKKITKTTNNKQTEEKKPLNYPEQKKPEIKIEPKKAPAINPSLQSEERALIKAWISYTRATTEIAQTYKRTTLPEFITKQESLLPRYKPNVVDDITRDALLGWVIMLETFPNQVSEIHPNSSDEHILTLAERTSDPLLQDALISYVEILIELEACDIAYQNRLISAKKKHLEVKINQEHNNRREKIYKYIQAIEKKKFPIDANKLITNYFKVAAKDPQGAWDTLTTNPSTFAPIELDKVPTSFFKKKPKPEDGFKWNKKIAAFLKKLKV